MTDDQGLYELHHRLPAGGYYIKSTIED